jgi:hypothetical protein
VNQAANTCSFTVNPASLNVAINGGSGSFTITTSSGCSWTTSSSVNWIAVAGGGSASGIATYFIVANQGGTARTGTITIAGKTITVNEAGMPAPNAPTGLRIVGRQ